VAAPTLLEPPAAARQGSAGSGNGARGRGRGDGGRPGDPGDSNSLPLSNERLLMILALIASTMLFTALVGAFIVLRAASPVWPPGGSLPLKGALALNTAVIVVSSAALVVAHVCQRRGRARGTKLWLLGATAGAVVFLVLQARCWRELLLQGFLPATNNYGASFYLLTITHFVHAAVGLLFLLLASGKALRGYLLPRLSLPIDLAAMFWHFVDFAWLVIFFLLTA